MRFGDRGTSWRRAALVAQREVDERGRSRSFRLATVAVALLVAVAIVVPTLGGKAKPYRLGLAGTVPPGTAAALQAQAKAAHHELRLRTYDSVAAGEGAVRDRDVDALLRDGAVLEWRREQDPALASLVSNAVQAASVQRQAQRLGISDEQLGQLLVPTPVTSRRIGTARTADEQAQAVGLVAVVLLFLALSVYGSFVLTGVVQEKSNRVAEVLLSRMPAREILLGKVVGIGALGLAQLVLVAAVAGVTAAVVTDASAPDVPGSVLAGLVVWFVLGYAFYSVVYAALGAMTSRVEDAQSASTPVTALLVVCYFATLYALDRPDSAATVLLSFLPPTAPLVMPLRIALGAVPLWQVVASGALTLVTAWGLLRVAGRLYSGALLRAGARVPLREAWRSATR